MSHRGGRRRQRPPADLRIVGALVLCPRCGVQIARTRPSELSPKPEIFWNPKLIGAGWYSVEGVWRLSEHGKAHVERGETPHPAHAQGWAESQSWYEGADPATGGTVGWGYKSETYEGIAEAHYLESDALVACPSCGAVACWTKEPAPG